MSKFITRKTSDVAHNNHYILKWLFFIIIAIALFSIFYHFVIADNMILQDKLYRFCMDHDRANEYEHWEFWLSNWERCFLIGSAQAEYETKWWEIWRWKTRNNLFGFWWDVNTITFKDKTESLKFYVYHYYKFQYRKTISQIILGWCMYNLKNEYVCFNWFALPRNEDYYNFVKYYFNKNK